ncbi:hypothetical protein ACWNT8_09165 [Pigmentibacter ruber]
MKKIISLTTVFISLGFSCAFANEKTMVEKIYNEIVNAARYDNIDPIHDALNSIDYDRYKLTDPRGKEHKLEILRSEKGKKTIENVVRFIVSAKVEEIEMNLSYYTQDKDIINKIKEDIVRDVNSRVLESYEYNAKLVATRVN